MSNIEKAAKPKAKDELNNLIKEFNENRDLIAKKKNGRDDINKFNDQEKEELRDLYNKCSALATKISERITDEEKAEEWKKASTRLTNAAIKFGSKAMGKYPDTSFDDVKGLESVKKIMKSFLFIAEHPEISKYYKMEGGLGIMMYGAPGTGKTMFAEAVAHELNLPLFVITPSDIFKSHVGESEEQVRQLFHEIENCPDGAVLFVDECESIFSRRTDSTEDYKAAVTTELLQKINGFGVDGSKRIMIAATNRPDLIDEAYLRFKRFSHLIHITPPDMEAKRAIIESKLSGIELSGITIDDIANMTEKKTVTIDEFGNEFESVNAYYSAANICGIIEEACRIAVEKIQQSNSQTPIPLTREMFVEAFKKTPPSITKKDLEAYENFRKEQ